MTSTIPKVLSVNHLDGAGTALVKPGTGIAVNRSATGDYIVSSTLTSNTLIGLTATTTTDATATVNLTPYGYNTAPIVGVTCVSTNSVQSPNPVIVSVSATSLVIKTFITQSTIINLLGAVVQPIIAAPGILCHIILVKTS